MTKARFLSLSIITLLNLCNFIIISNATLFSFPTHSVEKEFNNANETVFIKLLKSAPEGSEDGTHAALHVNSTFNLETPFATRPRCDSDDDGYREGEGGGFWCDHHEKCCHHNGYYHCCERNRRCCEGRCCHDDGGGNGHENGNGSHGGCHLCGQNERCCDYNGNYNCCQYGCCYGQCCGRAAG